MNIPLGCILQKKNNQNVCKLKKKRLLGLNKSPRVWFERFIKHMIECGYHQSNLDHSLYMKKQHGKITSLIAYVDDMVVTCNDEEERKAL